jgi:hypothetical protein
VATPVCIVGGTGAVGGKATRTLALLTDLDHQLDEDVLISIKVRAGIKITGLDG